MREEMKWFRSLEAKKIELEFGFEFGIHSNVLGGISQVHLSTIGPGYWIYSLRLLLDL